MAGISKTKFKKFKKKIVDNEKWRGQSTEIMDQLINNPVHMLNKHKSHDERDWSRDGGGQRLHAVCHRWMRRNIFFYLESISSDWINFNWFKLNFKNVFDLIDLKKKFWFNWFKPNF